VIGAGDAARDVAARIVDICSTIESIDSPTLHGQGPRRADVDIAFTVLADVDQLREVLLGPHRIAPAEGNCIDVVDLTPAGACDTREIEQACRPAGVHLHAARRFAWLPNGQPRSLLYVDARAPATGIVADVFVALAEQVVRTTDAKTVGLLSDLLVGVNAVALREALALGCRAGVNLETLVHMLQQGSGATALLGQTIGRGSRSPLDTDTLIDDAACGARAGLAAALNAAQRSEHSLFFGSLGLAAIGSGLRPSPRAGPQTESSHAVGGVS